MKTYVLLIMAVGALLVLAACNGDGDGDGDGGGNGDLTATAAVEPSPTVVPSPPPEFCPKIDDEIVQAVVVLLELEKSSYELGESMDMTLRLVNCASEAKTRTYPSAQRYDFVVKVKDGDEVWRWSNGMAFEEVLGEETYEPSQQLTFAETWDQTNNDGQPVEPGQYEVRAESTGCDDSLANCRPSAVLFIEITAP